MIAGTTIEYALNEIEQYLAKGFIPSRQNRDNFRWEADKDDFLEGVAGQLLRTMQRETKLREALQYIVDHNWVAGARPVKWINEFVDVAKVALENRIDHPEQQPPHTGKEAV